MRTEWFWALLLIVTSSVAYAGEFGTSEACLAIGGEFRFQRGYSAWQGRCYIRTTVQDCVAKGGGRTPLPDGSVECGLPIDAIDLRGQCEAAGGSWGRHIKTAGFDYCHIERFVADCKSKGGRWEARGRSGIPGCVLDAKDAGRACTSRSECEYACVHVGSRPQQDIAVVGQCARDNSPFGCRAFVEGGRFVQGPCVD